MTCPCPTAPDPVPIISLTDAERASLNNRHASDYLFWLCRHRIGDTATDLFRLAGLGWEYLEKQLELAKRVYGYPDSVSYSSLSLNHTLATEYSIAVGKAYGGDLPFGNAYGWDLPVLSDLQHPSNLLIYRWFDSGVKAVTLRPEFVIEYTAALDRLFLVTWALAKLDAELDEEYRLIEKCVNPPLWPSWVYSFWDSGYHTSQQRAQDAVQLWLEGSKWHTQSVERAQLVAEAEEILKGPRKLVKDARARGDIQMAEWAVPEGDEWWRTELDRGKASLVATA
ncbi:hypothetical protein BGX38DRAFT_1191633 [Terfezia claveryi]|nr:hypothetical protein BGX38DRAFT_1191633 [Terfezia claveryi]